MYYIMSYELQDFYNAFSLDRDQAMAESGADPGYSEGGSESGVNVEEKG